MDLSVALAKVHAQQGHINEAVVSFTEALDLAADRAAKSRIITEASPLEGVLEKLAESVPNDGQLQAELARHFAKQGDSELADAARRAVDMGQAPALPLHRRGPAGFSAGCRLPSKGPATVCDPRLNSQPRE